MLSSDEFADGPTPFESQPDPGLRRRLDDIARTCQEDFMGGSSNTNGWQLGQADKPRGARDWLDTLSSGSCDEDEFAHAVLAMIQAAPDSLWDVLALLDQYYRRGKIESRQFLALKDRLSGQVRAVKQDTGVGVRLPEADDAARDAHRGPLPSPPVSRTDAKPPAARTDARTVPVIGDVLRGRYRLQAILGKGARGTVFEALDQYRAGLPTLSQRVALKVLRTEETQRPRVLTDLHREFQVAQSLSHPNIARVYEFDRDADVAYFTMELLDGAPLSQVLSARNGAPLGQAQALAIIRDVGAALAYAHARGVVHGDVNPRIVFITNDGEVRVLDFGSATSAELRPTVNAPESVEPDQMAIRAYASYQVLKGQSPERQDDIYALACLAYELIAGKHPFHNGTAVSAHALRLSVPRPAGLARRPWRALRAGLQWERKRRPPDIQTFLEHLNLRKAADHLPPLSVLLRPSPPPRSLVPIATASVAFALLLIAGIWVWVDGQTPGRPAGERVAGTMAAISRVGAFFSKVLGGSRPEWVAANVVVAVAPASKTDELKHASRFRPQAPATGVAAVAPLPGEPSVSPESQAVPPADHRWRSAAANVEPVRIDMAAETVEISPSDPVARITVRRFGNLQGILNFNWWTDEVSAKAGEDFVPFGRRTEQFLDGQDTVTLLISIVSDSSRRESKSFFVSIGDSGDGASLGTLARTLVIIPAVN